MSSLTNKCRDCFQDVAPLEQEDEEQHKSGGAGGEVVWLPDTSSAVGAIPSSFNTSEIFNSFLTNQLLASNNSKPQSLAFSDSSNSPCLSSNKHPNTGSSGSSSNDHRPRPFGCPYCQKHFLRRHHLQQHVRLHTGERPFVCNICNKNFVQQSSLISHSRLCFLPNQQQAAIFPLASQPPGLT